LNPLAERACSSQVSHSQQLEREKHAQQLETERVRAELDELVAISGRSEQARPIRIPV
jgi:hypothetical protein